MRAYFVKAHAFCSIAGLGAALVTVLSCGASATNDDDGTGRTNSSTDAGDERSGDEPDDDLDPAEEDPGDDVGSDGDDDIIADDDANTDDAPIGVPGKDTDEDAGVGEVEGPLPGGGFISIDETEDGIEILCGSVPCACADGVDNDDDGLKDGADSECTGPFDHDESTFATGIPGDNKDPKWQDCFFDGNSGAGDDGCRYHTDCLTGAADASDTMCAPSERCRDYCEPLTPPGCDCFGCCEIDNDGERLNILVSETCSLANIEDEQACPRCNPTALCQNECGECEICLGQTLADLPESCFEAPPGGGGSGNTGEGGSGNTGEGGSGNGGSPSNGGSGNNAGSGQGGDPGEPPPPNVCDSGGTACFDSDDCSSGTYCSLGCCISLPAR